MNDHNPETLVIAFNFPPFNDGSAVTIAKRIVNAGKPVDVIAADLSSVRNRDDSLFGLIAPLVNRVEYVHIPITFASEVGVRNFVEAGLSTISRFRRKQPYASIFSRSMWAHSHFLAAELRARGVSKHWTAEFSDPLLWQADASARPSGAITEPSFMAYALRAMGAREQALLQEENSVLYWAQMVPYILADELLFTNEQQLDLMLQDAPQFLRERVVAKAVVSPHPTPQPALYTSGANGAVTREPPFGPQSQAASREPGTFRIGYFGTFYPNRGGGEFLEALSLLPPVERHRIRLDVYSSGADHLIRAARHLGLRKNVRVLAPLPYREFLSKTQEYDALLVNDIATTPFRMPSPFLPSKYSDYAGSKTPTIAITIPGSPLDQLPTRWKSHVGMIDSLAETLRTLLYSVDAG
ncbi:hypothetical protein [Brachybacterium sp. UNK5269]|uniref:hypothetical protein n=1 Tax=Brachybacterium sp. UNK5269 TaxID=3408576 RepID=UPI003BAE9717